MVSKVLTALVSKPTLVAADVFYLADSAVTGIGSSKKTTLADIAGFVNAGINIVLDTTPQLGGNLNVNDFNIVAGPSGDINMVPSGLGHVQITGPANLTHVATFATNHGWELSVDAAGFADTRAISVEYKTGAVAPGAAISVSALSIDRIASTGGSIVSFSATTTSQGGANVIALGAGSLVDPILHLSGALGNASTTLVLAVDQTLPLQSGGAGNITIFVADGDTVTVGAMAKFQELEFVIDTPASGPGISPTFEFSTGVGTFASFAPFDGTNGFRTTGSQVWLITDIPTWVAGAGGEFLIRITRTQNTVTTVPIIDLVQLNGAVTFSWDKDGIVTVDKVLVNAGTAALPSMSFAGDPDTGLHNPSANQLDFTLGGNAALKLFTNPAAVTFLSLTSQAAGGTLLMRAQGEANTSYTFATPGTGDIIFQFANTASEFGRFDGATGNLVMVGRITNPDGTAALPSIAFTGDPDTGFFRITANEIGLANSGALSTAFHGGGIRTRLGSATFPAFAFTTSTQSGMFQPVANTLGFATAGIERMRVSATDLKVTTNSLTVGDNNAAATGFDSVINMLGDTASGFRFVVDSGNSVWKLQREFGGFFDALAIDRITGTSTFSGVAIFQVGSAALPGIAMAGDINTGVFSAGPDDLGLAAGGVSIARFRGTQIFSEANGTLGSPAYSFQTDTNTGMISVSADVLGLVVGGDKVFSISTNAAATAFLNIESPVPGGDLDLQVLGGDANINVRLTPKGTGQVLFPVGSAALPGITFSGDTDTGLSAAITNDVQMSTAGVKRTQWTAIGDIIMGAGTALATTTDRGFLMIQGMNGIPTGTPLNGSDTANAIVVDTLTDRLYVRVSGAWKFATLT